MLMKDKHLLYHGPELDLYWGHKGEDYLPKSQSDGVCIPNPDGLSLEDYGPSGESHGRDTLCLLSGPRQKT